MASVKKTITDQGIRIVTEKMDSARSIAAGVWFETGSRDETKAEAGISHFLEHMMFKGTEKRSALRIAREIEQVGGYLNAFTGKEVTAYYAHLLDEHTNLAIDTLADIVSHSQFSEKMIQREQGVVIEEIAGYKDSPDDVIHEDFSSIIFKDHRLGLPILGTKETVASFNHDSCHDYWSRHYTPERTLVVATGNVDHDKFVKKIEKKLELPSKNGHRRQNGDVPAMKSETKLRRKDIVQAHLCLGTRGMCYKDHNRFTFFVLNTILGSGMSSRLFQRIREKNGLAYSIYSFNEAYHDTGIFGIYAGLEEKQVKRAEKMIREELKKLMEKPLSKTELQRSKDQLKGGLILSLENVSSRMNRLARNEIYLGDYCDLDDLLDGINSVTSDQILELANNLFGKEMSVAYLLPNEK